MKHFYYLLRFLINTGVVISVALVSIIYMLSVIFNHNLDHFVYSVVLMYVSNRMLENIMKEMDDYLEKNS